jgi:putative membrane protein
MRVSDPLWLLMILADASTEPSAPAPDPAAPLPSLGLPETFWPGLFGTLVFGIVGLALAVLGFKVFDWLTPRIDVQKELAEKQNVAVAVVVAAVILGVCYVVAHVVR